MRKAKEILPTTGCFDSGLNSVEFASEKDDGETDLSLSQLLGRTKIYFIINLETIGIKCSLIVWLG